MRRNRRQLRHTQIGQLSKASEMMSILLLVKLSNYLTIRKRYAYNIFKQYGKV